MSNPPDKTCAVCGRRMEWRRRWARNWDQLRTCSRRCRGRRLGPADRALEDAVVRLLERRPAGATLCPSEAARAVAPEEWEPLLERAREAGRRLAAREVVAFRQGGRTVDPSTARGALRLGHGAGWARRHELEEAGSPAGPGGSREGVVS